MHTLFQSEILNFFHCCQNVITSVFKPLTVDFWRFQAYTSCNCCKMNCSLVILFSKFLTLYKVATYAGNTPWQKMLINDFIRLVAGIFLKTVSDLTSTKNHLYKMRFTYGEWKGAFITKGLSLKLVVNFR